MSRDIVEVSSGGQWEGCVGALSRYSVYDSEVFGDAGLPPVQDGSTPITSKTKTLARLSLTCYARRRLIYFNWYTVRW